MTRRARTSGALSARIVSRAPLTYRAGASADDDRPGHVRAGSGVAWVGPRLCVVQDDANVLALVDPAAPAACEALLLAPDDDGRRLFEERRGNKHRKLDLESCVVVADGDHELLLAFGSGSTPARERVVVARGLGGDAPTVDVRPLPALYAQLRERRDFSGSELNVEGVAVVGDGVWLFQRGNGGPRDGFEAVSAIGRVSLVELLAHLSAPAEAPCPALRSVERYDLGTADGVPLTFTDAARTPAGALAFLAAAEASPDTYADGPVSGVALGVVDARGDAYLAPLVDEAGAPFLDKAEGLVFHRADPRRAYVVVDKDDPDLASELCVVVLDGPWPGLPALG